MSKKLTGLLILGLVIAGAAGWTFFTKSQPKAIDASGLIGGEKIGLFEDPAFKDLMKKKFNMTLDYKKAGSIEMVQEKPKEDFLFPSSQVALDIYKSKGYASKRDEIIFNTPIVLYSWTNVADSLEKAGVIYKKGDVHYVKMDKLSELILEGKTWKDIGNTELYGKILVDTTDPNKSNSGNMFLGLLANSINKNEVVSETSIKDVEPKIKKIYQAIGYMQSSSSDMFKQYLTQGMGSFPLIAGYENQILEYSKEHPEQYSKLKDKVVVLYPEPTVWSSHVMIASTDSGVAATDALMDKDIQKLSWKNHGFRSTDAEASPDDFKVKGIAKDVTQIMQMPSAKTMQMLMEAVQ